MGYTSKEIEVMLESDLTYGEFFEKAPVINPDRMLIMGSVCDVKLEHIADPLMKDVRYLDKLVDELSKGKSMDKILRK